MEGQDPARISALVRFALEKYMCKCSIEARAENRSTEENVSAVRQGDNAGMF